MTVYRWNDSRP